MKPLNNDNTSCNPISSNCVIWQGPDIECIKLCKGDTISDVVFKLATELCTIMDELKITSYDLSCFNIAGCDPKDFQALLQFLINKICALENCCATVAENGSSTSNGSVAVVPVSGINCPDCITPIAPVFYFVDAYGNEITTMQLSDYVYTIGTKVQDVVAQAGIVNEALVTQSLRIGAVEDEPVPTFTIPTVIPTCVLPSVPTEVQIVVTALEQEFCLLEGATGTASELYVAINQQCAGLASSTVLGPGGGPMSAILGWVNPVNNLADSLNNMWLTICDIRAAIQTIQANCCPSGCDGILLTIQAVITAPTTLTIYITGTIPSAFTQCSTLGTTFIISDALGGSTTQFIDVISNLNNAAGVPIDLGATPVNPASNLTIESTICLIDSATGTTCETCVSDFISNEASCPTITLTPDITSIAYSYFVPVASGTYTIQLYNNAGTVLISQNINAVVAPDTITGTFTGLVENTPYRVRLVITIGSSTTTCPFTPVVTLPGPCPPPSSVTAVIVVV